MTSNVKVLTERDHRLIAGWLGVGSRMILWAEREKPLVLMTNDLWMHLSKDSEVNARTGAGQK